MGKGSFRDLSRSGSGSTVYSVVTFHSKAGRGSEPARAVPMAGNTP